MPNWDAGSTMGRTEKGQVTAIVSKSSAATKNRGFAAGPLAISPETPRSSFVWGADLVGRLAEASLMVILRIP